uniref:Uncharacterized protein n=1 Tax=Molossus molossus TaxID=27622 RepID=A0A7J8C8R8_MOLMO|nr:hypothetical protein HJG59_009883 [Molossus molossus]
MLTPSVPTCAPHALPPTKASPGERKVKSLDRYKPFPANDEVVQMCSLRVPAAAAQQGVEELAVSIQHCTGLLAAPLSGSHLKAPSYASVLLPSQHRQASGHRWRCLPGTSTPGCVGASRHLLGLIPRLMSHREEHDLSGE